MPNLRWLIIASLLTFIGTLLLFALLGKIRPLDLAPLKLA